MQVGSAISSSIVAATPPAPQTSVVGGYGSFWMPGPSSTAGKGGNGLSQGPPNQEARGEGKVNSRWQPTDLRHSLKGAEGKPRPAIPAKSVRVSAGRSAPANPSPVSPNVAGRGGHPVAGGQASGTHGLTGAARENIAVVSPDKPKPTPREGSVHGKSGRMVDPDAQRDGEKRKRRGAGNAPNASALNERGEDSFSEMKRQVQNDLPATTVSPSTVAPACSGGSAEVILRHAVPLLARRMALLLKEDRRVARFALDLPGGTRLGVRVEVAGERVSITFVTADPALRKALGGASDAIGREMRSLGLEADVPSIVADYAEADAAPRRVAA